MNLAKTWSSVVLPIDNQYCEYRQVHELMCDRKTTFCKHIAAGVVVWLLGDTH